MDNRQVIRYVNVTEIDCGRNTELNPRLVNAVTIFRAFDTQVNDYRPIVIPITQIFDPFNEINFHSSQNFSIPSLSQGNNLLNTPPLVNYPVFSAPRVLHN